MSGPWPGGGLSTKTHACTDALGRAVRLRATAGQAGDCPQALPLLAGLKPAKVLADTAYDSNANRAYCAANTSEVIIPSRANRVEPAPLDKEGYKDRNQVERFFNRLKHYRRLATRYDKTIAAFLGFWHLAAALDWLR